MRINPSPSFDSINWRLNLLISFMERDGIAILPLPLKKEFYRANLTQLNNAKLKKIQHMLKRYQKYLY